MKTTSKTHNGFLQSKHLLLGLAILGLGPIASPALAQSNERPALIITTDPIPQDIKEQIYTRPVQVRDIDAREVSGDSYYAPQQTLVSQKINQIGNDLSGLQQAIRGASGDLSGLQRSNDDLITNYNADIATIRTQLQSGTTPGNPRLVQRLDRAQGTLSVLENTLQPLNQLADNTATVATEASFLLEASRAAYSVSGAIEEDHVRLAELEDSIQATIVVIERMLNNVNEDLSRTTSYLSSERSNLRTLSLAVAKGDLYGESFVHKPFVQNAAFTGQDGFNQERFNDTGLSQSNTASLPGPRPLVKIRFDRTDVNFEQPLYSAVNEALERYPNAQFTLVAVHPAKGNAAERAIQSTRARRHAETVLRTLTQMGLPAERVLLSYDESADATTNEVHVLVQ